MKLGKLIRSVFAFLRHYPNARLSFVYTIKFIDSGTSGKIYTSNKEYIKALKDRKDIIITKELYCRYKY